MLLIGVNWPFGAKDKQRTMARMEYSPILLGGVGKDSHV